MERLLEAIQVRKLDRLAAAYAVGAWLVVQAASIVLPTFDAPGWILKALILFAILGFPLTLTLGWMGARHLPSVALERPRHASAHLAALTVVAIVLVLIVGEGVYLISKRSLSPADTAVASAAVPAAPVETSIAVLPFANMTGDPKQDYFSDGMSEELLGDLADVPELRVVARTSSFAFKGKNEDVKTIGRLLAVRSLLEGSVREAGQHLRVHAELINASNGYDRWSSTFDRDMTDALAVQDEIARAIVKALTHRLLPSKAGPVGQGATDPEAYRNYLQAQFELAPRTRAGTEKALALFGKAISRRPNFAEAYAGLGRASILLAKYEPERTGLMPSAQQAIDRALALDPKNLDALGLHLDLAMFRMDWKTARDDARRMQAINPHSQAVLHEMFRYYQIMGFPEEALRSAQGAAQLNRLSIVDRLNVVAAFLHLARWDDAAKAGEEARKLYPNQPNNLARLCMAYAHSNRADKAQALQAQLASLHEASAAGQCAFHIAVGRGDKAKAIAILGGLAALYPKGDLGALDIGDNYAIAGDDAEAIKWLGRSYDRREFVLYTVPYDKAIAPAFFDTLGFKALWQRPLARDWQAAHDAVAQDLAARPAG